MKKNATHIIGRQPVLEALREGNQLERVFIQRNVAQGDCVLYEDQ